MNKNYYARDIYQLLGYKRWENFNSLILRAINLIQNGLRQGNITESYKAVEIGSGCKRKIIDYILDKNAYNLVKDLSSGYKLNNQIHIRNEIAILKMVKQYCEYRNITCEFQVLYKNYRYDMRCGRLLLEFDEPHHISKRQRAVDSSKNNIATQNGYELFRIKLNTSFIDIIKMIDKYS